MRIRFSHLLQIQSRSQRVITSVLLDALDAEFIARLSDSLEGCRYNKDGIGKCLEALEPETDEQQTMRADCLGLFRSDF